MCELSKTNNLNLINKVTQVASEIIWTHFPQYILNMAGWNKDDLLNLCNDAMQNGLIDDLHRFSKNDPAAKEDSNYVLYTYKGFRAMIYYRVAHAILSCYMYKEANDEVQLYLRMIARKISEEGKVETGIDIHPAAQIGPGCIIDHGVGTKILQNDFDEGQTSVAGETVIIGKNCTILNDVVIGSSDVNKGQIEGRRQPKIGNNVTICAGARLYGKIEIGDNVWIGSKCIIHQNIPSNTKVIMENQYQISNIIDNNENIFECDGLIKEGEGRFILGGIGMSDVEVKIIDENYSELNEYEIIILNREDNLLRFSVKKLKDTKSKRIMLKLIGNQQWHYYFSRLLLRELL